MTNEPTTPLEAAAGDQRDELADSETQRSDAATDAASPEELTRQRDDYYDRLLRMTAEFDNYRKRVERERRDLADATAADVITDLLPVLDDLERALQVPATTPEAEAYRRGFEIIHRQWLDVLRRRGVAPLEVVGHEFDPRYHEAIAHEATDGHRDGEIIGEVRRGYLLRDRLLRAAMVRVAKA